MAARQADVYLTWGEPPDAVAAKLADVRARATELGRALRFGIRLHIIVRETEREAWAAADDLIRHLDDRTVAAAQDVFRRTEGPIGTTTHLFGLVAWTLTISVLWSEWVQCPLLDRLRRTGARGTEVRTWKGFSSLARQSVPGSMVPAGHLQSRAATASRTMIRE